MVREKWWKASKTINKGIVHGSLDDFNLDWWYICHNGLRYEYIFKIGGDISDSEYEYFYNQFIIPFEACDTNHDWLMDKNALANCFTKKTVGLLTSLRLLKDNINDVFKFMDNKFSATFYDYLFLRKFNVAMETCSDGGYFAPNKLYCALAITTPRSPTVTSQTEKMIFNAAIILTDGFYYG